MYVILCEVLHSFAMFACLQYCNAVLFCSRLRRAEEAWRTMEEPWALEAWDLESSDDERIMMRTKRRKIRWLKKGESDRLRILTQNF